MADNKDSKSTPDTKAPQVAPTQDEVIARAVSTAIKEAMPAIAAVLSAAQPQQFAAHIPVAPQNRQRAHYGVECQICGQPAKACGGEGKDPLDNHVKMAVYPTEDFDGFPGLYINHVHYRSNHLSHLIWIPRANESDFKVKLNHWMLAEREMRLGRKKMHHSGTMGNGGNRTQPAYIGPSGL